MSLLDPEAGVANKSGGTGDFQFCQFGSEIGEIIVVEVRKYSLNRPGTTLFRVLEISRYFKSILVP